MVVEWSRMLLLHKFTLRVHNSYVVAVLSHTSQENHMINEMECAKKVMLLDLDAENLFSTRIP